MWDARNPKQNTSLTKARFSLQTPLPNSHSNMKDQAKKVVDEMLDAMKFMVKNAEQMDMDVVHLTTGRTREFIRFLQDLKKEVDKDTKKTMFDYLDKKLAV